MYSDVYADPTRPPNFGRFTFLDSAARRFYPDWNLAADMLVANLRTAGWAGWSTASGGAGAAGWRCCRRPRGPAVAGAPARRRRAAAGKDPHDRGLHDLVGELSTRSDDFRRRWGAHDVRTHGTGTKAFHHHIVGDLTVAYESLDLRTEPDLTLTIHAAEPQSPTAHALTLLASWAAIAHDGGTRADARRDEPHGNVRTDGRPGPPSDRRTKRLTTAAGGKWLVRWRPGLCGAGRITNRRQPGCTG
jgi:hypothetical protein